MQLPDGSLVQRAEGLSRIEVVDRWRAIFGDC
jgi:hypothetical protein